MIKDLVTLPVTDSTNRYLKELAAKQALPDGFTVTALRQTSGRGRLGRTFFSPEGTGLYMSVYYNTPSAAEAMAYTPLCACAVCRALESVCSVRAGIKWVNDIYLKGKKLCGILCEKTKNGVVLGIGLNLKTPPEGFPEEIRNVACSLAECLDGGDMALCSREKMLDAIRESIAYYAHHPDAVMPFYRERMFLTGRYVSLPDGQTVLVTGVSDAGALQVRFADGREMAWLSGEVTLHGATIAET